MKMKTHEKSIMGALLTVGLLVSFAQAQEPLKPLDGGTLVQVAPGEKGWSDRDYTLNVWPDALKDHKVFLRSPMKSTRVETFTPGCVVVLTPLNKTHNQSDHLLKQGFEFVELEPFHPYLANAGKEGQLCIALQKKVQTGEVIEFGYYGIALWSSSALPVRENAPKVASSITIPTFDISGETNRHVIIAAGTEETYQGHVDTVLMPDGKTMFAVWVINHAGHMGPLARSTDGGLTWERIETPADWLEVNGGVTPTIHRLVDPNGVERLFVFAGQAFPGRLRQAYSEDEGKTWTSMRDTGLAAECPPKTILSFDDRQVMWCDRRDPASSPNGEVDPVVWMSESFDGGLSWAPEKVVVNVPTRWAQPAVIRSADGQRAIMLMRDNKKGQSPLAVSEDGGETWSTARKASWNVTGHRPHMVMTPDGRIVAVFRDTAAGSETEGHFVAWVGTFDDLFYGRPGQYRIKLLHSNAGWDTGYSGLEALPDGTVVATTYVKYRPGPEKHSVVCTRFKLEEIDAMVNVSGNK
jgi:hypothetical protein